MIAMLLISYLTYYDVITLCVYKCVLFSFLLKRFHLILKPARDWLQYESRPPDSVTTATSPASKTVTPEERWANKKFTAKHDLQVIIGLLCDVAQVVPSGRPFIRSLIDAMFRLKAANYLTR